MNACVGRPAADFHFPAFRAHGARQFRDVLCADDIRGGLPSLEPTHNPAVKVLIGQEGQHRVYNRS